MKTLNPFPGHDTRVEKGDHERHRVKQACMIVYKRHHHHFKKTILPMGLLVGWRQTF
jgi:hypothetical protein